VTPDGRYLFFTSVRWPGRDYRRTPPGFDALRAQIADPAHREKIGIRRFAYEDLYWVKSGVIEHLRREALQ
jgi:hypothetical protein